MAGTGIGWACAAATRRLLLAVLVAVATLVPLLAPAGPAFAENERRTIFDLLFRPRQSDKGPKIERVKPKQKASKKARKPADEVAKAVEKAADARIVLVIGDFIGSGLADGLVAAYAGNPAVRIVDRTDGSSGLVRADHFDWPARLGEIVAAEKPSALVVALGANDRQQMKIGASREQPLTETWTAEYRRRAESLAAAAKATGVPLIWVGQPSFKPAQMSTAMLALNDIFRATAEAGGATYVDLWDGFVDEAGTFVTSGPDINGQPARLRASDGVSLAAAGRRKAAFYVEKPLGKLLGQTVTAPALASVPAATTPADAPVLDRTALIGLDDPSLDGGAELLGAAPGPAGATRSGIGAPPPDGRADAFAAPPRRAAAAIAP